MISTTYTATTTPVLIAAARPAESRWIYIHSGANDIYIGGATVTSSTGLRARNNDVLSIFLPALCSIYAVTASSSHPITVMEPVT